MITLNAEGVPVVTLPHDWSKFRAYLVKFRLGNFNHLAGGFTNLELLREDGWYNLLTSVENDSVFYRLKGDGHWRIRLFYLENEEAFSKGSYAIQYRKDESEVWKAVTFDGGIDLDQAYQYRILALDQETIQQQLFYEAVAKEGRRDELFMDMLRSGDMTYTDLQALIKRRPEVYGKYSGFLDYLKPKEYKFIALTEDNFICIKVISSTTKDMDALYLKAEDAFRSVNGFSFDLLVGEDNPLFERITVTEGEWEQAKVVE